MEQTKKYSFMKYYIPFESYEIVVFKYMRIENTAVITLITANDYLIFHYIIYYIFIEYDIGIN
jgi:hypothetical protein